MLFRFDRALRGKWRCSESGTFLQMLAAAKRSRGGGELLLTNRPHRCNGTPLHGTQHDATGPWAAGCAPDNGRVTRSFSVEAEFLVLKDRNINLHKMNGVKIALPV